MCALVRAQACYCLATLTVGGDEKRAALQAGLCPRLIAFVALTGEDHEASERVATAATAALMSLTIDNDCKAEAVRNGALRALVPLLHDAQMKDHKEGLDHANSTLTQNVTKIVSNLAEHPLGRSKLRQSALMELLPLQKTAEPLLSKNAQIAVQKVTWQP